MGERIRGFDWAQTSVGRLEEWPLSLRVAVELCLNSRFPMLIWWGPGLINLYNDAYAPMMGSRHPGGLGSSARDLWREIWGEIGPQVEAVMERRESTWNERRRLMLERNGYPEECYFTWSYSPILEESGSAAGIFCSVTEETGRVMAERARDEFAERYALQSRRFEKMLSSITDLAYVFDLEGRFIFANQRLLTIWGKTAEEAMGVTFRELHYPPALAEKLMGQIQRVIETREPLTDEVEFTDRRGHRGYYEYIYSPILGADGEVEAVAGVTRELTERKRMEEERERLARMVQRERETLGEIIEQSPAFIAVVRGPEHVYEMANEHFYELVGRRDLIGKTVREAFPDVADQGFYELMDRVYQTGETFTADEIPTVLRRADGSADRRYLKLVYQVLRDADQEPSGIFIHGVDLTEVVASREALKENEAFHRFAAEAGQTGSWDANLETMESIFSPMMCELVGLPTVKTTLRFEEWSRFVVPEHRDRMQAAIALSMAKDAPYENEFRIRREDGAERWLSSRGRVIRDGAGKPVRLCGATVDITEKKVLTEERERLLESERAARTEAENANRAKDKFLAVLSHELRTPLSPVVMTIPALESDPELPAKFRDDLAMVRRNIELEVKLIDDLLDLSRIRSGKLALEMQGVRAHELLRHVVKSCRLDASAKGLTLREELGAEHDELAADPARLQQVFWNLLRNAVKFTPEGGSIVVRSGNSADGMRFMAEVEDSGVGIPSESLPRVFDAFEQGDAGVTRQFGGLGLGLAISKAVVEMHGGTIVASSGGRGRGAVFRVELQVDAEQGREDRRKTPTAGVEAREAGPHRILVVEDHPDTVRTMARLLQRFGYRVSTASSVTGALEMLEAERFDVVISDIGLPDGTGYELMKQVRQRHGIQGIALSGYGMEEDIRRSHAAGFSEHLVKPVDFSRLQGVLKRLTSG